MKKMFSFIGALFLGSAAFAQVSKTDSTNKTVSRKVTTEDVKNLPADSAANAKSGHFKVRGDKLSATEKQNYTIKMSNAAKKATADSAAAQKSKDFHIKMPAQKN